MFPILLLPSIAFALFISLRKGWRRYLLIAVLFILAFLLMPMNWWSRFTIFFCAFSVLSFAVMMEHLPNKKAIFVIALPIIVFTMIAGNAYRPYTPETLVDFLHRPLSERQSSALCARCGTNTELFQKISERPGTTILYTDVPDDHSYHLWDSSFTNTVINIPKYYANYEEFMDYIEKFGESRILTTDDSDIAKYCGSNETKLQLIYQRDKWLIISYIGDDDVQKEQD